MLAILRILRLLIGPVLIGLFLLNLYKTLKAQHRGMSFDGKKLFYELFRKRAGHSKAWQSSFSSPTKAYDELGLSPDATVEQIKSRYRELVAKFHPDRCQNMDEDFQRVASEKFKAVHAAYEQLRRQRGF